MVTFALPVLATDIQTHAQQVTSALPVQATQLCAHQASSAKEPAAVWLNLKFALKVSTAMLVPVFPSHVVLKKYAQQDLQVHPFVDCELKTVSLAPTSMLSFTYTFTN